MISRIVFGTWRTMKTSTPVAQVTTGLWLCLLVLIELLGRETTSDWFDLASFLALLVAVGMTVTVHRQQPLSGLAWIERRTILGLKRLRESFQHYGVDFRPAPRLRTYGLPGIWGGLSSLTLPILALGLLGTFVPAASLREVATTHFYLPWIVAWGFVVATGVVAALLHALFFYASAHDLLMEHAGAMTNDPRQTDDEDFRIHRLITSTLWLAAGFVLSASLWIDIGWAVGGLLAGYVLILASTIACGRGLLLTRRQSPGTRLMHVDGRWLMVVQWSFPIALAAGVVLFAGVLPERGGHQLTILTAVQRIVGWTACLGTSMIAIINLRYAWLATLENPASAPGTHALRWPDFASPAGPFRAIWAAIRWFPGKLARRWKLLSNAGEIESNGSAPAMDVESVLIGPAREDEETFRVRRRSEIAARREIIRGLERLIKPLARQRQTAPAGIIIGLQHWFMLGLASDGDRESRFLRERTILDQVLSWPFYRTISHSARHHYWKLAKGLDLDLVYLEKGLTFRRFVKVLRVMFEVYDMHGGRQRAEERHFGGLPGTRVIIHELDVNRSLRHGRTNYPEPEYDDISRARILHIFRDRGDEEVLEEVPQDFEGAPVFSAW